MKNFKLFKQCVQKARWLLTITLLLTLGVEQMWADTRATWIGKSFIVVGGYYYRGSGEGSNTQFQGHDFGTITSLSLGGQVQDYGQDQAANHLAKMWYKFDSDDNTTSSIELAYLKYESNNNWYQTTGQSVDISGLSAGDHNIGVWFEQPYGRKDDKDQSIYDSNNSANYVASFHINPLITFYANDGTEDNSTQRVPDNTSTALTANSFSRTGYTFLGWATSADGGKVYDDGESVTLTDHLNLYAVWTPKTTTVSFNTNGGSAISNVTATYDAAMPEITKSKKLNYAFNGIYDAASDGTQYYTYTGASARNWDKTDATKTLYVYWTPAYKITIDAQYNSSTIEGYTPSEHTDSLNNTYSIPVSAPSVPGYAFSSWTLGDNMSNDGDLTDNPIDVKASAASTLTANYTYATYDVTYTEDASDPDRWSYSANDASVTYKSTGHFTVTPAAGYEIEVSASDESGSVTLHDEDNNTYSFVQGKYPITITVSASESTNTITIVNGKVTGGDATEVTATVATTTASVTADPAPEGKKFEGWSFGNGGISLVTGTESSRTITFHASQNTTITAVYTDRSKKTVHFAKPYGWGTVTAKFYQDVTAKTEELTEQGTFTYEGATYYTFWYYTDNNGEGDDKSSQADWNKVVFSDNGSDALAAKTINDGYYYAKGAEEADGRTTPYAEWYMRGLLNGTDNWTSNHYARPLNVDGTSATFAFGATIEGEQYYRIYRISTGQWFRYGTEDSNLRISFDTPMTLSTLNSSKADQFTSELGVYMFTLTNLNSNAPSLTVTHPEDTKYTASVSTSANGTIDAATEAITQLGRYMPTTITATANAGYRFKEWVTTGGAVVDDPTNRITTATATADGTITATFTNKYIVYFDKAHINSVWTSTPYVYFYSGSYWNNEKGSGSKNILWGGQAMTNIAGTTIWYYDYSSTRLVNDAKQYIAFTNGDKSGQDNFDEASVVYRSDYYPDMNMYVPRNYIDQYLNKHNDKQTCYYEQGYWMKYREEQPGYNLRIYDGQGRNLQETIPFRTANIEARDAYTATFHVDGAAEAKLELIGHDQGYVHGINYTGSFYGSGGTINSSLTNWDWNLSKDGGKIHINLNSNGDYVFGLNCGTDGRLHFKVTFPISVGDFRIKYNGLITTEDDEKGDMYSDAIPHLTEDGTRKDTVSFFVTNQVGKTATLSLEKCTAINSSTGVITWGDASEDFTGSAITSLESGVYLFEIVQTRTSGTTSFTYTSLGEYHGNYYVRTDWADGGWVAYKQNEDNLMPATNYASAGYTNYHCHYVPNGSVKFCVANKYNSQLSKQCVDDDFNADDKGGIESAANTRFEYDTTTNVVSRSYLGGSEQRNFLYIRDTSEPDKIFKDNGTTEGAALSSDTAKFIDNENWIYTLEVKAIPEATYKLEAVINVDKTQYFVGSSSSSAKLLGGEGGKQKMRLVYDYKNNHLIKAFIPSGAIGSNLAIEADLMIIREHQGNAQQISFENNAKLSEVQTVYGAMKFNKWTVNNKSKADGHAELTGVNSLTKYERDLFWISFPFDVKLSDVFGFGEYGTHWIIEYYDGKGRAKNGFWADSPSNWKFVTPAMREHGGTDGEGYILNANEGYILALDLDSMTETSSVWKYGVEDVYVYFPSNGNVGDISTTTRTVTFTNQNAYKCIINRPTPDGNRTIKDSYWHCIGVPSYAEKSYNLDNNYSSGTPDVADWSTEDLPFLYEWNSGTNTLTPKTTTSFTFKPMYSYLVQYSQSTMVWVDVNATPASVAARLTETPDREFQLALIREDEEQDHTYVRLTDDASVSNRFEFNYDLSKEYNAGRGNIWTVTADTVEVAGNSMPKPVQATVVPVGVKVVANGEYTLAMPEGTNGEDVYLIDNAYGTRTNLGLMPYTVTLTAGTYDSRFALEFGPIQDAPTSLENDGLSRSDELNDANDDVRKVFVGGRLYIIRDGKVYDAAGQRVE